VTLLTRERERERERKKKRVGGKGWEERIESFHFLQAFIISLENKRCVILWACHLHFKKYLKAKGRIAETQIFHHAKT
jgi:hypothetical protein